MTHVSQRAKRKRRRNIFLDMEAQAGEEEDEDEEEDGGYGMSDEAELDDEDLPTAADYVRKLPARAAAGGSEDEDDVAAAEREAKRIEAMYGRDRQARRPAAGDGIPRGAMMMPKPTDPKLWLVKCRPGKERDAVAGLCRGLLELERLGREVPQVFSAVCRDTLKGYIYVEAFKAVDIGLALRALRLTHLVFASEWTRPSLVPMGEMADVLVPGKARAGADAAAGEANPGDWVRVKRGKYSGDLAQVLEVPNEDLSADSLVKIRVLPRLSYRAPAGGRRGERPPARPFDPQEAAQHGSVTKTRGLWVYAQEFYRDGMLVKEVKLGSLQTVAVHPRPEELERFGAPADDGARAAPAAQRAALAKGDRVVVVEGDLKGIPGRVDSVQAAGAWVTVVLQHADVAGPMAFRAEQLRRRFELGDAVRVLRGPGAGESGLIVDLSADYTRMVVLAMGSQQQHAVAAGDVQDAESAAAPAPSARPSLGATEAFELNDLVQTAEGAAEPVFGIVTRIDDDRLLLVDQSGASRHVPLREMRKVDTRLLQADVGSDPAVFRAGDRVQVDAGAGGAATRPATIIQVYRTVAFVRALDTQEILTRRFAAVHRLGPYRGAGEAAPARLPGGTGRHLLGKSVTIAGGPYKGYVGIVKDVAGDVARVELHTNSKIIAVPRDRLVPVGGDAAAERRGDDTRFSTSSSARTPAWGASKTPAWGATKTPAWNAGSGKTPAWNAAASGRTPAWNAAASGKTPAWNAAASGRTPAWNAAASSKTPLWGATGSAKTPVWSAPGTEGGRTPAWNSTGLGGKTPAWSGAAAPSPAWNQPAGGGGGDVPAWAQVGVVVRPRGSEAGTAVTAAAPGRITLASGQSYRPADLEPVPPAKKDRVRVLAGGETGTVIGIDQADAVVRMDDTGAFRVLPLAALGKAAP